MRAWRSRILLVAIVVLLPFELILIVSLWPYLPWVGKAFAGLLTTLCICGAVLAVAFSWNQVGIWAARRRRMELHSRLIDTSGVVVLAQEDGTYAHLSAQHESAKLALPAPVQGSEEPAPSEPDHWRILELAGKGMALRDIATATGTSYYHVQRITSNWKKKIGEVG